jgi:hypothetical protein
MRLPGHSHLPAFRVSAEPRHTYRLVSDGHHRSCHANCGTPKLDRCWAYSGSTFVAGPENASGTLQRIANHNFGGGMPTPTKIIYPPRPRSASDYCGIPLQRVLTFALHDTMLLGYVRNSFTSQFLPPAMSARADQVRGRIQQPAGRLTMLLCGL